MVGDGVGVGHSVVVGDGVGVGHATGDREGVGTGGAGVGDGSGNGDGLAAGFAGEVGCAAANGQAMVLIVMGPMDRLGAVTTIATAVTLDNVPLPVGSG